jgi:hypothetical protein
MDDEQEDAYYETVDRASPEFARADMWRAPDDFCETLEGGSIMDCYNLVSACIEKGYDRSKHGHIQLWLFDYLGEWLKTAPEEDEGDCFPNREEFAPVDLTIGRHPHPSELKDENADNAAVEA